MKHTKISFFFFFQAEDGIRDGHVTGVRRVLFRSLAQYQADGTTLIATGGTANSGTVVLKGTVSDPDSDQVKLEVEVKPTNVAFNGTGTVVDGFVASGQTALATVSGLNASTNYHWRARAVDANGVPSSSWTSYGGNSDTLTAATDFVTKAAPVATSGTATTNEDTPTTITLAGTTINTDELFSSTFGSVTTNTVSVDGWVDSDGSGSARSEERRVGKECRSRGWRDHKK